MAGTMAKTAYQHILTACLNIYVLELVVLDLGGNLNCSSTGRAPFL